MQKLILEFDDFHPHNDVNCLEIAKKLIEKYPPIILNFFVPPKYMGQHLSADEYWCSEVFELIKSGNINLAVHGLTHSQEEFKNLEFDDARNRIVEAENILFEAGLPFQKVFRGPHWGIGIGSILALMYLDYTHLYSHTNYDLLHKLFSGDVKVVHYNWNLKDEFGTFENNPTSNVIVGHGHCPDVCNNGINESYDRICRALDSNSFEFLRVGDF